MPYIVRKIRNQPLFSVKNAISGVVHSFHATKANAKKQVRLLQAIDNGFVPTKMTGGMDCFGLNCLRRNRRQRIAPIDNDNIIPINQNPVQLIRNHEIRVTADELFGPSKRGKDKKSKINPHSDY